MSRRFRARAFVWRQQGNAVYDSETAAPLLSDPAGLWLHKIAKRSLERIIVAALAARITAIQAICRGCPPYSNSCA